MGRREDRQTEKFKFSTYKIEVYRPTEGQTAALMAGSSTVSKDTTGKNVKQAGVQISRLFRILEALVVNPENWEAMDDALITGDVDLKDFLDLFNEIIGYEWDGDAAKTKQLAEQMREKTGA